MSLMQRANATVVAQTPFDTSTVQQTVLDDRVELADGRIYNYGKAGASNISKGKLETAPAPKTNHHNMAATATASGTNVVVVTLGATAAVAGEYAEGFLAVNLTPGQGQNYKVQYHPAANSAATLSVTLFDNIAVALTTASRMSLVHNKMNGVIEAAVATTRAAGVSMVDVTAANFAWLQTKGVAPVLADQAISLGALIAPSGSVAGAVVEVSSTYATAEKTTMVGQASVMAGVDTEYRPMVLNIA